MSEGHEGHEVFSGPWWQFPPMRAALAAALLGLWDEAAVLVFLYASAEALEEYAYARTRSAIGALLDLAPKEARVLREGREETVKAVDLRRGAVIVVRPRGGRRRHRDRRSARRAHQGRDSSREPRARLRSRVRQDGHPHRGHAGSHEHHLPDRR